MRRFLAIIIGLAACAKEPLPDAEPIEIGDLNFVLATANAGDLTFSDGAGTIVPGGGEPARGKADWYAPGILLADLTGDGRLDIYLPRYDNNRPELRTNLFYRNDGDAHFTDISHLTGTKTSTRDNSSCAAAGDFDRDGDLDLFVGDDLSPSHLFRNEGDGTFTDVAQELGLGKVMRAFTASFVDFDHDGRLDLFVGQWDAAGPNGHHGGRGSHNAPNILFRQRADGSFEEAAANVECFGRSTLATGFADVDNDGWEDLFVANDFFDACLLLNQRDGTFRDASDEWGVGPQTITAMGVTFGDVEGDGDLDVYVADDRIPDASTGNAFFLNDRNKMRSLAIDLGLDARFSWSVHFADFDNDGDVELFSATILSQGPWFLWKNQGDLLFEELGEVAIGDKRDARGAAVGDVDGDGRLDLVVALRRDPIALYLNRTPSGHWLRVRPLLPSGGEAIGAWIEVEAGGKKQVRTIVAGDGYRSQSELTAHFGLGNFTAVDRVKVRCPGGAEQTLEDVAVDRELEIVCR